MLGEKSLQPQNLLTHQLGTARPPAPGPAVCPGWSERGAVPDPPFLCLQVYKDLYSRSERARGAHDPSPHTSSLWAVSRGCPRSGWEPGIGWLEHPEPADKTLSSVCSRLCASRPLGEAPAEARLCHGGRRSSSVQAQAAEQQRSCKRWLDPNKLSPGCLV